MRIRATLACAAAALAITATVPTTASAATAAHAPKTTTTFALLHTVTKARSGWTLTYDPAILCWTWKALPANCKGAGVKVVREFDDGFVNNPSTKPVTRHVSPSAILFQTDVVSTGKCVPLPKRGTRVLKYGFGWMLGWVTVDSHGTVVKIEQQYTP